MGRAIRSSGHTEAPATNAGARGSTRLLGLDVARAIALIGMLAVHIGPTNEDGLAARLYALPHGRAAVLFVVIAGVGVSFLAGSRRSQGSPRAKLLWRAGILLPAGLALQLLDHGVYVILGQYAVLFAIAILFVGASDRWLLGSAAAIAVLGPVVHLLGQAVSPLTFERSAVTLTDAPAAIAHGLVLSGAYPVIVWLAPFLLGLWLGRRDLRDRDLRVGLVVVGATAAIGAWLASSVLIGVVGEPTSTGDLRTLAIRGAHSQMPLWIIGSTGVAGAILGAALLGADRFRRALWPLAATGQLALTIYVGHLVALHLAPDALTTDEAATAYPLLAAFALVLIVGATLWRAVWARGPLEAALAAPWTLGAADRAGAPVGARLDALSALTGDPRASRPPDDRRERR